MPGKNYDRQGIYWEFELNNVTLESQNIDKNKHQIVAICIRRAKDDNQSAKLVDE